MAPEENEEYENVIDPSAMDHKMCLLLASLRDFYSADECRMQKLMSVLGKDSTISLRMLDWLVTNYSRKTNVNYAMKGELHFNIFIR